MQKYFLIWISQIIAILTSLMACNALSASELNVVTEYLPPLNYEQNGKITGYSTELLQLMLNDSGIDAKFALLPWARAYQMAITRPNTLIYSITRIPEREELFEWIGPINQQRTFLFKLQSRKDVSITSIKDVSKYIVGLVRETASTKMFVANSGVQSKQLDYAPTIESNVKKLLLKRVDLIILQKSSAIYYTKVLNLKYDELEEVLMLEPAEDEYFGLSKPCDPEMSLNLKKALEKMEKSGKVEQLKDKYLR